MRSARLDVEQEEEEEEEEEEEHSLTQTRLTRTVWTHASIFRGRT
jgi:hypothetical protein